METTAALPNTAPVEELTSVSHVERWVTVEHRPTRVDVGHPRFEYLDGAGSSLVREAWYDPTNDYMVVDLDGVRYHYCGISPSAWSAFVAASSLGSHYNQRIKGQYDCRSGAVPGYD